MRVSQNCGNDLEAKVRKGRENIINLSMASFSNKTSFLKDSLVEK